MGFDQKNIFEVSVDYNCRNSIQFHIVLTSENTQKYTAASR